MRFVLAAALVAYLPACSDPQTEYLAGIRDQVCACKSAECAEKAVATVPQKDVKSTPKTQKLANEMLDCLAKLYRSEQDEIEASERHDHGDESHDDATGSGSAASGSAAPGSGSAN
jgi:hypothetical protein